MQKKYQIFISSPFRDLEKERAQIIDLCLKMGHIPAGMEMFNAPDLGQFDLITRRIDLCDYYCIILARRYGSRPVKGEKSYTELEFDYAVSKGIPVVRCLLAEHVAWLPDNCDKEPEDILALNSFRKRLSADRMTAFWKDTADLSLQFLLSLAETIEIYPRSGWIRANNQADENTLAEMARLSAQNERLRAELEECRTRIAQEREFHELAEIIQKMHFDFHTDKEVNGRRTILRSNMLYFFNSIATHASIGVGLSEIKHFFSEAMGRDFIAAWGAPVQGDLLPPMKELTALALFRVETSHRERLYHLTDLGSKMKRYPVEVGSPPQPV